MRSYVKRLFFLLTLFYVSLYATPISLDRPLTPKNILKEAAIFIDIDGNRSVKEVLAEPSLFTAFDRDKIELGFTGDHVWIRFKLINKSTSVMKPHLVLDNPMLDHIDLYRIEDAQVVSFEHTGLLRPYDFQGTLDFDFGLNIPPDEEQEYLLHVSTTGSALYFNATVMDQQDFFHRELHHQLLITLFIGLILGLIVYNFFIFFFTRDIIYLYYVGYQCFVILNYASLTTISKHLLGPRAIAIDAFMGIYYLIGAMSMMLLFTRSFLKLQDLPLIDLGIKTLLFLGGLLILLTASCCYLIDVSVYLTLLSSFYLLGISLFMWFKGHPHAIYILLGWSVSLFGSISLMLYQMGSAPYIKTLPYLYESTVVFEALLFSIVLARRLNHTEALTSALATQKILTRELHHRVKNNMQLIISLYRLKFSYVKDNTISTRLIENENNIIAMSTIHEALYAQEDLQRLDTEAYFKTLISLFHTSIEKQGITVVFDCRASLYPQQAIYCGIILNELVTNSIKYAFRPEKRGTIFIALYDQGTKTIFHISDDGKGFDRDAKHDSFGLELVKALAEKELQAKMMIESVEGTAYLITWDTQKHDLDPKV